MADFTDKAAVKTFLGITSSTDNDLIDALLARTTKMMQRYTGRVLLEATYTDQAYEGDGINNELLLKEYPVSVVSSIKEMYDIYNRQTITLVEHLNYEVLELSEAENPGIIRRIDGPWTKGIQNFQITYTAGYSVVPVDLVQAQIDWVSYFYQNRDSRIGISSYRLGAFAVAYKDNTLKDQAGNSMGPVLPPDDVRMVLDFYRDPRMESTSSGSGGLFG